jgi:hypothetical protein
MAIMTRPASLPRCFGPLWERLAREDAATGSRRKLAAKLRISTHTLQRLLVDGDVPDLTHEQSTYVVHSWVRTLSRVAIGLGMDPIGLVESTGLNGDDRMRTLVETETARLGNAPAGCQPTALSLNLAGFLSVLLGAGEQGSSEELLDARRQMQASLEKFLVASGQKPPGMAGAGDLADGRFCRSCMASLTDPQNKGASLQFCRWCSDEDGRLRPEQEVHSILTNWFQHWQAGITGEQAAERARHYMLSMPAWASAFKAR